MDQKPEWVTRLIGDATEKAKLSMLLYGQVFVDAAGLVLDPTCVRTEDGGRSFIVEHPARYL